MKGVVFVFWLTSYIPSDYLEECEGKKSFCYKMSYKFKRRKKIMWFQASSTFPLFCLLSHTAPPCLLARMQRGGCSPSTCSHTITLASLLCKSPKQVHFLIIRPLNVHKTMPCLYSKLGDCCPGLGLTTMQGRHSSPDFSPLIGAVPSLESAGTPEPPGLGLHSFSQEALPVWVSFAEEGLKIVGLVRRQSAHQMQSSQKSEYRASEFSHMDLLSFVCEDSASSQVLSQTCVHRNH